MEGSRAQSFDINNEKLRKIQKGALQPSGSVQVDYFGHSCIRIVSPLGLSILIDPWRNDPDWGWWFPEDFPEVEVDIAISTHAHFDHDALHIPKALITMERMVGDICTGGYQDYRLGGQAHVRFCRQNTLDGHSERYGRKFRASGQQPSYGQYHLRCGNRRSHIGALGRQQAGSG